MQIQPTLATRLPQTQTPNENQRPTVKAFTPNAEAVKSVSLALLGNVSPTALAVGQSLAGFVPFDFHRLTSWPTYDTLMKLSGIGRRANVRKAFKELEAGGHIKGRRQHRQPTLWFLTCLAAAHPEGACRGFIRSLPKSNVTPISAPTQPTLGPVGMPPPVEDAPPSKDPSAPIGRIGLERPPDAVSIRDSPAIAALVQGEKSHKREGGGLKPHGLEFRGRNAVRVPTAERQQEFNLKQEFKRRNSDSERPSQSGTVPNLSAVSEGEKIAAFAASTVGSDFPLKSRAVQGVEQEGNRGTSEPTDVITIEVPPKPTTTRELAKQYGIIIEPDCSLDEIETRVRLAHLEALKKRRVPSRTGGRSE